MTESTQAPDGANTPMDTDNSESGNNTSAAKDVAAAATTTTGTGQEETISEAAITTTEAEYQISGDKNSENDRSREDNKTEESESIKKKKLAETVNSNEHKAESEQDSKKCSSEKASANDALSEDAKTLDNDKHSGPGESVERMETDLKEESTVDQKKRFIRESPCGNDCSNGCNGKFTEDQRIRVYDIYWALPSGSDEQQKWMEKHCIDKAIPKVSSKSMASTRNRTFVYLYFLPQPDDNMQKIRVCKKFLAATLGITERILSGFVYRFVGSAGLDLDDGEWSPAAGYEGCTREQIFLLREFIQALPALPVHYCRNEQCTRKLYELPASIPDVSTLYGMYSSAEESLQRDPVDESVFRAVLHQDYNLGFSSNSRGDLCNVREYRKAKK